MHTSRLASTVSGALLLLIFTVQLAAAGSPADREPPVQGQATQASSEASQPGSQEVTFLPLVLHPSAIQQTGSSSTPKINVPFFEGDIVFEELAIFWFGGVTPTENYADVRIGYNAQELVVHVAIFDRLLWYDTTPAGAELAAWDAATLYLDLEGNGGDTPSANTYRFTGQVNWNRSDRTNYQVGYRGTGAGWAGLPGVFTTETGYRGNPLDTGRDNGWRITYYIPFTSLGLSGPPSQGTLWGLGVSVHDRDDAAGSPIADQTWPKGMDASRPSTWGRMSFGLPADPAPGGAASGSTTIRHGLNGVTVTDGGVGGGTNCAKGMDFFAEWGETNYSGVERVNVQNQWDLADWPCFSKFYITFPLDTLPAGKTILSAELTIYQFGSAGGGEFGDAPSSLIQASIVGEDWDEATLTWNNAPQVEENVSQSWVEWVDPSAPIDWPGYARTWNLSRAVAEAYAAGKPLRLAFYSADSPMHSGKYFITSDTDDWNAEGRPTLNITWGEP